MIRVVIDANVYISALVFGGVPRRVIQMAQEELFQICISQPIMEEVAETLAEKFGWTKRELAFAFPPLWQRCFTANDTFSLMKNGDILWTSSDGNGNLKLSAFRQRGCSEEFASLAGSWCGTG